MAFLMYRKTHMDAFMYVKNTHAGFDINQQHMSSLVNLYFRLY